MRLYNNTRGIYLDGNGSFVESSDIPTDDGTHVGLLKNNGSGHDASDNSSFLGGNVADWEKGGSSDSLSVGTWTHDKVH